MLTATAPVWPPAIAAQRSSVPQARCSISPRASSRFIDPKAQEHPSLRERSKQVQLVWRLPSNQPRRLTENEAQELTKQIKACTRWEQLHAVCERHGRFFNHINLSAAITHLAQLHNASTMGSTSSRHSSMERQHGSFSMDDLPSTSYAHAPTSRSLPVGASQLLHRLLSAAQHQMSGFGPRQIANMLWAAAKCGIRPKPTWIPSAVSAAGLLWGQFEAQHISNMAYALALLGYDPGKQWLEEMLQESVRTMDMMKPQELANLVYALSFLMGRRKVGPRVLAVIVARSRECMDEYNGHELAMLAWAMSKLVQRAGHTAMLLGGDGMHPAAAAASPSGTPGDGSSSPRSPGGSWMYRLQSAAQLRMHAQDMSPQGLTCILLASARLKHRPPDAVLSHMCSYARVSFGDVGPVQPVWRHQLLPKPRPMTPQGLSNLLLGLAHVGYIPNTAWMTAYEAAATQCLKSTLRALAGEEHYGAATARAEGFAPQHLGNVLWAMGQLGWTPSPEFLGLHLACTATMAASLKLLEMSQVLQGLRRLKIKASKEWLELCCNQTFTSLGSICGKEATILLSALAWQGYRPCDTWMHALTQALLPQLRELPARSIAQLLHGLAQHGYRPSGAWMGVCMEAARMRSRELSSFDAASMLWDLAMLDVEVSPPLLLSLIKALGTDLQGIGIGGVRKAIWVLGCMYPDGVGRPAHVEKALRDMAARLALAEAQYSGTESTLLQAAGSTGSTHPASSDVVSEGVASSSQYSNSLAATDQDVGSTNGSAGAALPTVDASSALLHDITLWAACCIDVGGGRQGAERSSLHARQQTVPHVPLTPG